jgi:hypothetical protein
MGISILNARVSEMRGFKEITSLLNELVDVRETRF